MRKLYIGIILLIQSPLSNLCLNLLTRTDPILEVPIKIPHFIAHYYFYHSLRVVVVSLHLLFY